MTTATKVTESLAEALGRTHSSVESYGLVLRRMGWWAAAKRGRGARAMTSMEAAKLLLAVLSEGPNDLTGPKGSGFFLRYANLALSPGMRDDPVVAAIRDSMGLKRTAGFLDYLDGLVRLFRDNRATDLVHYSPAPDGFLDDWAWGGPNVDVRVKGPFPLASISFLLSHEVIERMVGEGHSEADLMGPKTLAFVHQMYGWRADAIEDDRDTDGYDGAIEVIRKQFSRGVQFERALDGRAVDAVAKVLAKPESSQ